MKKFKFISSLALAVTILVGCTEISNLDITSQPTVNNVPSVSAESSQEVRNSALVKIENPTYVDGDTVKGVINGKKETVRILLVDTPETKHPTKGVQPFGLEASDFTKKFVEKNKNSLYVEFDVEARDKYDRMLGYIWNDKVMLNEELVLNGMARVGYVYESKKHLNRLQKAEGIAKNKSLGIWSLEGYVTSKGYNENYTDTKKKAKETQPKQSSSSKIPDSNKDGVCNDIKGNQGSSGWIYHLPGGSSYEKTNPEELFCTTSEAEQAGYRASGQ